MDYWPNKSPGESQKGTVPDGDQYISISNVSHQWRWLTRHERRPEFFPELFMLEVWGCVEQVRKFNVKVGGLRVLR